MSDVAKDKTGPMISESMLSEYSEKETDARWYYNLLGVIASQEPIFWNWMHQQVKADTVRLMGEAPQAFLNPILPQELGKILVRAYMRAHFLGIRKYESSLASVFQILQMPNEPSQKAKKIPPLEDTTLYGEVEPGDLEP